MVFSSLEFIFVFLPIFLFVYLLLPWKIKNIGLFLGSLVFYGYAVKAQPYFLMLLLVSIVVNYMFGHIINQCKTKQVRKWCLILGLCYDFGWLIFFKYLGVVTVMPPGISFYTFQTAAYLMDVYYEKTKPEDSFLAFGTYVSMFPQLISGPIVTYPKIREQLNHRKHSLHKIDQGLRVFTIGLGMKVLLANRLSKLWNDLAAIGYESISTPLAWMGIVGFSLQIYFDFYGYSLMAAGVAQMMGFSLPENFRQPYTAVSMTDFWRRWHITLGSWFREYVYIPLGGNRKGFARQILHMLVVWTLTGMWHGATLNFLLWGGVLFLILVIERVGLLKVLEKYRVFGHAYMIFLIPITWLIFAITDFAQLKLYFMRLFPFVGQSAETVYAGDFIKYGKTYGVWLILGIICSTGIVKKLYQKGRNYFFMVLILLLIFWASVYCLFAGMDDPFLYFNF